eukprot:SAG11_NODE_21719_length_419_cov_47.956250_1_plen_85_part_10
MRVSILKKKTSVLPRYMYGPPDSTHHTIWHTFMHIFLRADLPHLPVLNLDILNAVLNLVSGSAKSRFSIFAQIFLCTHIDNFLC